MLKMICFKIVVRSSQDHQLRLMIDHKLPTFIAGSVRSVRLQISDPFIAQLGRYTSFANRQVV